MIQSNTNSQKEPSLYDLLKEKSPELAIRLDNIKKKGLTDWLPLIPCEMGSHSGYPHLNNVERNANKILPLPVKISLTGGELFLLLTAIFLHDIGRIIPSKEIVNTKKINGKDEAEPENQDFGKIIKFAICLNSRFSTQKDSQFPPPPNEICKNSKGRFFCILYGHYLFSEEIIFESWPYLELPDEKIAEYCALLVYTHGLMAHPLKERKFLIHPEFSCPLNKTEIGLRKEFRDTSLEPYGRLRIRFLASIIRLADEAENHWNRAVSGIWLKELNNAKVALRKATRRCIEDVEFNHEGECIILHMSIDLDARKNENTIKELNDYWNNIMKILNTKDWMDPLIAEGIHYNNVFFETEGYLNTNAIIDIDEVKKHSSINNLFEVQSVESWIDPSPIDTERYKGYWKTRKYNGEVKKSLEEIIDAIIALKIGTWDYDCFSWDSLNAQMGRNLSPREKWWLKRVTDKNGEPILRMTNDENYFLINQRPEGYSECQLMYNI